MYSSLSRSCVYNRVQTSCFKFTKHMYKGDPTMIDAHVSN